MTITSHTILSLLIAIITTIHAQVTHKPTSQPIGSAQARSAGEASLSFFILIVLSIIGCSVFCCCCRRRILRRYYQGQQEGVQEAIQYDNQAYPQSGIQMGQVPVGGYYGGNAIVIPPSQPGQANTYYPLNVQPMTGIPTGGTISDPPISMLNAGTPVVAIATYAPTDGGGYLSQQQIVYGVDGKQIK